MTENIGLSQSEATKAAIKAERADFLAELFEEIEKPKTNKGAHKITAQERHGDWLKAMSAGTYPKPFYVISTGEKALASMVGQKFEYLKNVMVQAVNIAIDTDGNTTETPSDLLSRTFTVDKAFLVSDAGIYRDANRDAAGKMTERPTHVRVFIRKQTGEEIAEAKAAA